MVPLTRQPTSQRSTGIRRRRQSATVPKAGRPPARTGARIQQSSYLPVRRTMRSKAARAAHVENRIREGRPPARTGLKTRRSNRLSATGTTRRATRLLQDRSRQNSRLYQRSVPVAQRLTSARACSHYTGIANSSAAWRVAENRSVASSFSRRLSGVPARSLLNQASCRKRTSSDKSLGFAAGESGSSPLILRPL